MLASLLPGLRQVRTPLAAGYLYFLAIWLLLGPTRLVPSKDGSGAPRRLAELIDLVGPTATLTAVTFTAYLVGSILVINSWPFGISVMEMFEQDSGGRDESGRGNRTITSGHYDDFFDHFSPRASAKYPADWATGLLKWVSDLVDDCSGRLTYRALSNNQNISRQLVDQVKRSFEDERFNQGARLRSFHKWLRWRETDKTEMESDDPDYELETRQSTVDSDGVPADAYTVLNGQVSLDDDHPYWKLAHNLDEPVPEDDLRQALDHVMDDEVELVSARLRAQNEHVADEIDRLENEAGLRYSISPPLVLIVAIACFTWHWAAVVLAILPLVLLRQAYLTERRSVVEVLAAIQYGNVSSPTADAIRSAIPRPAA